MLIGKRVACMAECAKAIVIDNEEYWARWKENKCATNFEKPTSKRCELKKRDEKKAKKLSGLCSAMV